MSINQTRKLMEKKGCGIFLGIVGFLLGLSFLSTGNCSMPWSQGSEANANQAQAKPLVKVKDSSFSFEEFDMAHQNMVQQALQQNAQQAKPGEAYEGMPIIEEANLYMQIAAAAGNQALIRYMAKDRGVDLTDAGIRKALEESLRVSHESVIADLKGQGKIKPGATEADIAKALKDSGAQPIEEQIKQQSQQLDEAFKDTSRKQSIVAYGTGVALMFHFRKDIKVTEEDLKKSFETINVKSISVSVKEGEKETAAQKADRIVKEIKAGLSFESAIEKYSAAVPPKGQSKTGMVTPYTVQLIDQIPDLAPLKNLKANEVSAPINFGGSTSIFKVVNRAVNLPKDFATTKESLLLNQRNQMASKKLTEAMETTKKLQKIEWAIPSFELLSKLPDKLPQFGAPTPAQTQDLIKVWDEALKLAKASANDQAAIYAAYIIGNSLWRDAKEEARAPIRDRYMETLEILFTLKESPQVRLELAELQIVKKDPKALESLSQAAQNNLSFGKVGQANQQLIFKLLDKAKGAKLGDEESYKKIEELQSKWLADKKTYDENVAKQLAEMKKQEEEAKKAQAEAEKKLKEEEAKAKADAAKTGGATGSPSGTSSGTQAPPQGGASSSSLTNPNPAPSDKP